MSHKTGAKNKNKAKNKTKSRPCLRYPATCQSGLWRRLCLPEQAKLSQKGWVGAALLRAGLTRCVMLRTETLDLCQDLSGKRKTYPSAEAGGTIHD